MQAPDPLLQDRPATDVGPAEEAPADRRRIEPAHADPLHPETWLQVLGHALRGTGGDPTKGPLRRAIILPAVPMVLEMVMESVFAPVIVSAFGGTPEASTYAVWTPTVINFFCFWLFELPAGWALAFPLGMGPNGIFIAMMLAFSSLAVVSGVVFRRGRWKDVAV